MIDPKSLSSNLLNSKASYMKYLKNNDTNGKSPKWLKSTIAGALAFVLGMGWQSAMAYPIDGYDETGIDRLEFYRLAQLGEINGRKLHDGAKWDSNQITLGLVNNPLDTLPASDPEIEAELRRMLSRSMRAKYSITLLDYTDPNNIRYAEYNPDFKANVGSVGKVLAGLGIFAKLAEIYPNDIDARVNVLKNSSISATSVVNGDRHKVPLFNVERRKLSYRRLRKGDEGNLWEWLDWMYSASSNGAASEVMEQLVLLSHFREAYPPTRQQFLDFLRDTTARERGAILREALDQPLIDHGIEVSLLRQGRPFTGAGRRRYPGGKPSIGNSRELMKFLAKLESGTFIDEWSSLQMKKLMYMTQRRIRYASHPVLRDSGVYFKSGSLYSCYKEPGFSCGKYKGNRVNLLASLAIVETPSEPEIIPQQSTTKMVEVVGENGEIMMQEVTVEPEPMYVEASNPYQLRYAVVVHSNVLRKNSAVAHQTLALRIHRMLEKLHGLR